MQWPDAVNGAFELIGGLFVMLSIRQVLRDKAVKGVSWWHPLFFSVWGFWNVFFYWWAGVWLSWAAGIWMTLLTTTWVSLLFYYSREGRAGNES